MRSESAWANLQLQIDCGVKGSGPASVIGEIMRGLVIWGSNPIELPLDNSTAFQVEILNHDNISYVK